MLVLGSYYFLVYHYYRVGGPPKIYIENLVELWSFVKYRGQGGLGNDGDF